MTGRSIEQQNQTEQQKSASIRAKHQTPPKLHSGSAKIKTNGEKIQGRSTSLNMHDSFGYLLS